jgi:antitoxin component YwqK of YwqJK toxin-antitoxin module
LKTQYHLNKLNGKYETFYSNGQLESYGFYEDDNKIDLWQSWYDHGSLKSEIWYENGKKHGLSITYYDEGKIQTRGYYENDKLLGIYEQFHRNGVLAKEIFYFDGWKYGLENNRDEHGIILSSGLYYQNERNDLWTTITDHKIKTYGSYINGSKYGPWKSIMNNFIFFEENYCNDRLHGVQIKWFPNGNLYYQGRYHNGDPYGQWVYFYPNGQLAASGDYTHRNPLFKVYDPKGLDLGECYISRGGHGISFYKQDDEYLNDSKRHGMSVTNNNNSISVRYYLDDVVQDYSIIWTWDRNQMVITNEQS